MTENAERLGQLIPADMRATVAAEILTAVCELEGYTSPDENPELLQCTSTELDTIVRRALGEDC